MSDKRENAAYRAMENYKKWQDAESENIDQAQEAFRFVDLLDQWPAKTRQDREKDGRPCLVINKLPTYIKQVVNDQRQSRPAIRVRPVDSKADVKTAKVMNGLIRNIEEQSSADAAYDTGFEHAAKGGWGYILVDTEYSDNSSFDLDIKIRRVHNVFSVGLDPSAKEADGSDAMWGFIFEKVNKDDYTAQYGDFAEFTHTPEGAEDEDWFDDDLVYVCNYYEREKVIVTIAKLSDGATVEIKDNTEREAILATGITIERERKAETFKVNHYLCGGGEELDSSEWPGKYIPIIPIYGNESYIDGQRYLWGMVRDAMDPARMYNYWRTITTEQIALAPKAPWIGPEGFVPEGHEWKWEQSNQRNFSYLEYDKDAGEPPQRQFFAGTPVGALQETMSASEDIKAVLGLYDASIGARSNETSGKAILARQREGDVVTFNYQDNLARAIKHVGRILVDLIPKIYDTERIVRILNPDGEQDIVPVNSTYYDQKTGRFTKFDLSLGKYDVAVDTGPSFTTQRQEAMETLMEFVRVYPASAPVVGDLIAKNMDWPGADEIAERLKAMLPAQLQGQDPQMAQYHQRMQAVIGQLQGQLQELSQDKSLEARKIQIDEYKAETDRIKVQFDKVESDAELDLKMRQNLLNELNQGTQI